MQAFSDDALRRHRSEAQQAEARADAPGMGRSTKGRRMWHKIGNVLAALPESAHPAAKAFGAEFGVKWPKAAGKITDDLDVLLSFYDYPAEHWIHLRTSHPIESTFATVRLRTRVTKGPGSRAAGVATTFKLIEAAQARWRMVNAPTSLRSSGPEPSSSTANSSNDPETKINKG